MVPAPTVRRPTRNPILCTILVFVLLAVAVAVDGATFQRGDVIIATSDVTLLPVVCNCDLTWLRPDGSTVQTIAHFDSTPVTSITLDALNRLYGSRDLGSLTVWDSSGAMMGGFGPPLSLAGSSVFDIGGNLYVSAFGGIRKLDTSGNVLMTYQIPYGGGLDLAADQCTMFIVQGKTLAKFDVCRNNALGNITTNLPGTHASGVRILPDSSLLIADHEVVVRVSATGSVLRTYPIGADAIALAPDGTSFWVGPGPQQIDISSGAILRSGYRSFITGIAVVGEPRAATTPGAIPMFSRKMMLALTALLVLTGLLAARP